MGISNSVIKSLIKIGAVAASLGYLLHKTNEAVTREKAIESLERENNVKSVKKDS